MKRFITGLMLFWVSMLGCAGMDINTRMTPRLGCGCCNPAPAPQPAPSPSPAPTPEPEPKPKPHPLRPWKGN